jgi:glutamine amidotransferase
VRIAVVDYDAGNLTSVMKGLTAAGAESFVTAKAEDVLGADGVIIPGVGHFAATSAIPESMREALHDRVRAGTPLLGICLGLQYLFDGSEEASDLRGLGLFGGRCALLNGGDLKVPHVGWNTLERRGNSRLLAGVGGDAYAYFTHSYAAPITGACVASTTHGTPFASVVDRGRVFGVQFHPEKSGEAGMRILRNFVDLCR